MSASISQPAGASGRQVSPNIASALSSNSICTGGRVKRADGGRDEIRALSDRIAVMYEGRIVGEVENVDVDIEHLGLLMTGGG